MEAEKQEESNKPIIDDVLEFIQEYINPGLAMHGGYVEVSDYDQNSGIIRILMGGGCKGCASSTATLRLMITNSLMEEFPGLTSIEDATNHSEGVNPYY